MRRSILFFFAFAVLVIAGCGSAVEDKYDAGREKQEAKADKMMQDSEE